ncbi:helix-turn-helix domain-containing protein [Pseudomonas lopnurensis]|uniref:helix-turn-helix domain-containing protein n=1 Tax=Pseudomonas lopnurensis TaxID=1477517 RepID=UPI0028B05C0A|nr:helix-turn-helix transcriptional regulator [Pseudomonas lopnurensis]
MSNSTPEDRERLQLAERLKEAREYVGLSQDEVAAVLGVSRPSVSNMEAGTRKVEATELNKLAKLYRKSLEFLMSGREPLPSGPDQLAFLARAVHGLSQQDIDEVARFAEFLKHKGQ